MKVSGLIIILTLLFAVTLRAQEPKKVTLKEAIELAVANSKQLMLEQAKIEEAQSRVGQARDRMWPEVKASGTFLYVNTPKVTVSGSDNGGSGSGSGSGNPLASSFSKLHEIGLLQVSATEPIFSGFKLRNNKLMQEYLAEAAKYDAATAQSKIIANTAKAVYQYYELLESGKLISENLKQANQRVEEFKNLEAQGLLAKNDRLKAELQASNISLTKTEINNNIELAEFNLKILLGIPDNTKLDLDTTNMFHNAPVILWEDYLSKSLENRNEIKSAEMQVQAGESAYKIAKANRYPTIAATGGYVNAYIPNVLTVNNALNGGLSLSYNLTGLVHSKHFLQEAKSRQHQAEIGKAIVTDQIKSDVKAKYLNYQKSIEKLHLASQSIEQAEENYSITKNKFDAGLVILSEYLDADVLRLQTQINRATAKAETMIAFYELEESAGNLH